MRMAIQDRRRLFREGLCMLLDSQPDIEVVAAVSTVGELMDACDREQPNTVVFQAESAGEAARNATALRRRHRRMRIVGVYASMERHHASEITRAGVDV